MLNENRVLSEAEHMRYINYSAQKIIMYFKYLYFLERWYDEVGWELPLPCRTNFRDAWFHFKKLYERKDYVKIVQEEYALEEHLIRAVKDAIICYFQTYISDIEIVYKSLKQVSISNTDIKQYKKVAAAISIDVNSSSWALDLHKFLSEAKEKVSYEEIAWYIYCRDMDTNIVAENMQKCLHMIKNYYSMLRLNGTDIYRPVSEEQYMDECQKVYNLMIDCLEENKLKNVIRIFAHYFRR